RRFTMSKLNMARQLAKQTTEQKPNMGKEQQEEPLTIDKALAEMFTMILENQKVLNRFQHEIADVINKRLPNSAATDQRLAKIETTLLEITQAMPEYSKQQRKTRNLLITIFFLSTIPFLVLVAALGLMAWLSR